MGRISNSVSKYVYLYVYVLYGEVTAEKNYKKTKKPISGEEIHVEMIMKM